MKFEALTVKGFRLDLLIFEINDAYFSHPRRY